MFYRRSLTKVKLTIFSNIHLHQNFIVLIDMPLWVFSVLDLLGEGHYWQTRVLLSLKSCEYSDVCSGASRHQPDILLKLLN